MKHPEQGKDLNGGVYETPLEFLRAVDRLWKIGFDLAADENNAVTVRLEIGDTRGTYFDVEDDSLKQDWHDMYGNGRWLWLNPPYSDITPWAKKCAEEAAKGARILFLVPQGSQKWNINHCQGKSLELRLDGRMSFTANPKTGKMDPYPKDLSLFVFGSGLVGSGFWNWRIS